MDTAHLNLVAAIALKRGGHSARDILNRLQPKGNTAMWSAPIPLTNRAQLRVGYIKTDGQRISISACGSEYGAPTFSAAAAATAALGAMPPILLNDWAEMIGAALTRAGYPVRRSVAGLTLGRG
jgi:hypothetical protein